MFLQRLLPFAHELGVKYELRILSHMVSRQIAMIGTGMAMEDAQWQAVYEEVQQMVRMCELSEVDGIAGDTSYDESGFL